MTISLIVAMSENRVIGRSGQLPWRLSADLKRFKRLTMGHHMIMGRRTFESIGRSLPGRTSLVLTRQPNFSAPDALVAHDFDQALRLAAGDNEVFVVGGADIYRLALPRVDRIYMTVVHAELEGDTFFDDLEESQWCVLADEWHSADEKDEFDYSFRVYQRRR